MRDEEIRQLLENVQVEPSAHCWEAIESQIAAGAGAAATATAAKVAGHALSTTAKVIIGAVGAAAIATTAVVLSLSGVFSPAKTETTEKQIIAVEATNMDEPVAMMTETTEAVIPAHTTETQGTTETISSAVPTEGGSPLVTTEPTAHAETEPAVAETTAASTTTPQPTPAVAPATPTKLPTTPAAQKTIPAPKSTAATTQTQTFPLTDLSDPVLEDANVLNGIDFSQPVALVIPNIITPNGDGANDFFVIQGIEQCDRNRLIVRNSHGTIVFQTVNYQNNWGAPNLADGTYFYQFVYSIHGIEETRAGTLTIMR